jgi:serine/threonine protein kinase
MQDLSGGNVMLTSCSINPHGFQAKVGDFGLSRDADASARIAGNLYGTISHMAPEVMLEAQLGPVSVLHGCCFQF